MRKILLALGLLALTLLSGCGFYNQFPTQDEAVKKAWAEVLNQYQRRSDLIPNLVATVQGYANQEKEIFVGVAEARSRAGAMNMTADALNNPQAVANFQKAQGDITSALSRLLVVSENYPQLKSDANFRELQSQLEGTENRITIARKRFTDAVETYNVMVRQFPGNLIASSFGFKEKPQFTVENEKAISVAPKVDFGAKPAAPVQVK